MALALTEHGIRRQKITNHLLKFLSAYTHIVLPFGQSRVKIRSRFQTMLSFLGVPGNIMLAAFLAQREGSRKIFQNTSKLLNYFSNPLPG